MKRVITTITLLIICINSNYSQKLTGEIYYGHKIGDFAIDTTKMTNSNVKSVMKQQFLKKKKILSYDVDVYKLQFNESSSLFKPINTLVSDANPDYKYAVPNRFYFLDKKNDILHTQKEFFGKTYVVENKENTLWNLTNISEEKYGFVCYKATTIIENLAGVKTEVVAWFTKSIPLQLGPLNYNGLLGLIVELSHMENIYYLRKINYENVIINEQLQGQKITLDKYNEMIKSSFGL